MRKTKASYLPVGLNAGVGTGASSVGLAGILTQTDSSVLSRYYQDKNRGYRRCARRKLQIVGTSERSMMALYRMFPDEMCDWEVPRRY
jgi:hypothetical protein